MLYKIWILKANKRIWTTSRNTYTESQADYMLGVKPGVITTVNGDQFIALAENLDANIDDVIPSN